MKKLKVISIIIVVLFGGLSYYELYRYYNTYNIPDNITDIEESIKEYIKNPVSSSDIRYDAKNIKIIELLDVEGNKYGLFSVDEGFGSAELIIGKNGKYKIGDIDYFTTNSEIDNSFSMFGVFEVNKSRYLIIFAANPGFKTKYAWAKFGNDFECTIDIPQKEYYIAYTPVPDDTTNQMMEIKFY